MGARVVSRAIAPGARRLARPGPATPDRDFRLRWGTNLLGPASVTTSLIVLGAEGVRVYRLGMLPVTRTDAGGDQSGSGRGKVLRTGAEADWQAAAGAWDSLQ